jgi:galactitol-specific phosphotransferase system IIB component
MSNYDWEKFGNDIKKTVQDAVDSNDFGELNKTIANSVNEAMGTLSDGIKTAGQSLGLSNSYQEKTKKTMEQYKHLNKPVVQRKSELLPRSSNYFANLTSAQAGAIVMTVLGVTFSSIFFALFLITLLLGVIFPIPYLVAVPAMLLLPLFGGLWAGTGLLGIGGIRRLTRIKRFKSYIKTIGDRGYIEFQKLAQSVGRSKQYLLKDTRNMIRDGWFKQGYIDGQGTSLMVTEEVYQEYQKLAFQLEDKKAQEEAEAMKRDTSKLDPNIQEIVKAGEEYVEKIRLSNVKTVCPEIGSKISRIEVLLARIFSRVREEPETATDTRRLMDYYLPTTVKLIEAYQDLDSQPVQGENIKASKREIESTLDTLNLAFEKMLDSMFQNTAIDVSADISVLNTLLAQEGLTKSSFEKPRDEIKED